MGLMKSVGDTPSPLEVEGFQAEQRPDLFVLKDFSSCYLKLGYRYEQKKLVGGIASSVVKDGGGFGNGTK